MSQERSLKELKFVDDLEEVLVRQAEADPDLARTIRKLIDAIGERRDEVTLELHDYYSPRVNPEMESEHE